MLWSRLFSALLLLSPLAAQTGIVTTIAGPGAPGFSGDGGAATAASVSLANLQNQCEPNRFDQTSHIFVDSNNQHIRCIDPTGIITTIAGNGTAP